MARTETRNAAAGAKRAADGDHKHAALSQQATRLIAEFAATTKYDDLPDVVQHTTKNILIDTLGCALPGQFVEKGRIGIDLAAQLGGRGKCSILGTRRKTSSAFASFANGELFNALDFDAILAPGHVTPYVVPPALALAEEAHASGKDLIAAIAIAHEVGCRVSAALAGLRELTGKPPNIRYKLSPVSGYGSTAFGAVAGAAAILRFDTAAMANALGVAGYAAPVPSLTKYLFAKHSFHTKYTSSGLVALTSCMSALMGQAGYGGDETVLDGIFGFWRMFGSKSCNWEFMLNELGSEWRMLRIEPKPFPTFRMSHAAIDAFRQLIRKHSIDPDSITRVEATADPVSMADCYMNRKLGNHTDAQLSWPYVVAVSAYYEPGLAWQREGFVDPRVYRLMRRVKIVKSTDWAGSLHQTKSGDKTKDPFPLWLSSTVKVDVGDKRYSGKLEGHTKGHPDNPMTDADIDAKFLHNVSSVLDKQAGKKALKRLRRLETETDIADVIASLVP